MADKSKKAAFAKYTAAAIAAVLIIGVTVTTIMIKALQLKTKRKIAKL